MTEWYWSFLTIQCTAPNQYIACVLRIETRVRAPAPSLFPSRCSTLGLCTQILMKVMPFLLQMQPQFPKILPNYAKAVSRIESRAVGGTVCFVLSLTVAETPAPHTHPP